MQTDNPNPIITPATLQNELNSLENNFPVGAFPILIQDIIKTTNESLNFPIDFIGASLLFAASVAIGNTHKAQIKNNFQESAVLYLALVGRAGTNKSAPLEFALKPITHRDSVAFAEFERQKRDYDLAIKQPKKDNPNYPETEKPFWNKTLLSDYTPEALTDVHKFNKRGIGVYVDELAGWFKNFNRYNKGSESEFWLSIWSGKPINIDRKTGDAVFISRPFVSVGGTIQNGLLKELAKDNRTQNGFIDRILFVIPENLQKEYWNDNELPGVITDSWQKIISNLLALPCTFDETITPAPKVLQFAPNAKAILLDWQRHNTDLCNNAESEAIGSMYSKMDMYVVRLALILELLQWACTGGSKQNIGIEAINGAIALIEYFKNSALKVHKTINNIKPIETEPENKQAIYDALPLEFSTSKGLQIAGSMGMPERTFKNFLNDTKLFIKVRHGEYKKCF